MLHNKQNIEQLESSASSSIYKTNEPITFLIARQKFTLWKLHRQNNIYLTDVSKYV